MGTRVYGILFLSIKNPAIADGVNVLSGDRWRHHLRYLLFPEGCCITFRSLLFIIAKFASINSPFAISFFLLLASFLLNIKILKVQILQAFGRDS